MYPFKILNAKSRETPKIQRSYGDSHFGIPFTEHRKSFAGHRKSKAFMGIRISVKHRKSARRTPKTQRVYGDSHFGIPFTKHRKSFAGHRNSNVPMVFRISVSCSQNTEGQSSNAENPTYLWCFAFRHPFRRTPSVVGRHSNSKPPIGHIRFDLAIVWSVRVSSFWVVFLHLAVRRSETNVSVCFKLA